MKAEGKQGRRKYLRYGKTNYVSTPQPDLLQALIFRTGIGLRGAASGLKERDGDTVEVAEVDALGAAVDEELSGSRVATLQ